MQPAVWPQDGLPSCPCHPDPWHRLGLPVDVCSFQTSFSQGWCHPGWIFALAAARPPQQPDGSLPHSSVATSARAGSPRTSRHGVNNVSIIRSRGESAVIGSSCVFQHRRHMVALAVIVLLLRGAASVPRLPPRSLGVSVSDVRLRALNAAGLSSVLCVMLGGRSCLRAEVGVLPVPA